MQIRQASPEVIELWCSIAGALVLATAIIIALGGPRPPQAKAVAIASYGKSDRYTHTGGETQIAKSGVPHDVGPRVIRVERVIPPMPLPLGPVGGASVVQLPKPAAMATETSIWPNANTKPNPEPEKAEPKPERTEKRVQHTDKGRDVCAKHGMRKVVVGKRWRCKK
jgi:hypothetical protein